MCNAQSYPTTVELEVKPGLTWSQQVGVAIAVLVADKREFLLDWVTEVSEDEYMELTIALMLNWCVANNVCDREEVVRRQCTSS
jgi:hypothetical protein